MSLDLLELSEGVLVSLGLQINHIVRSEWEIKARVVLVVGLRDIRDAFMLRRLNLVEGLVRSGELSLVHQLLVEKRHLRRVQTVQRHLFRTRIAVQLA